MAWTTPMTAVANSVFASSQFNTYVRDNLNETMPAKATAAGQYFVSNGTHSLVARQPVCNTITSTNQFIGGSWVDITGGAVTVTTGTKALIHISSYMSVDTANWAGVVSFRVSGASTLTSDDHPNRIVTDGNATTGVRQGSWGVLSTLASGSNTFTMQGSTSSAGVLLRVTYCHIIVVPLS